METVTERHIRQTSPAAVAKAILPMHGETFPRLTAIAAANLVALARLDG